jgi:SAM-dependent methyltransferase
MAFAADGVSSSDYVRERRSPKRCDSAYLHLSDLRLALDAFRSADQIRVLDYCCGGSPYRDLYPEADYRRADVPAIDALDYSLDGTWAVPEKDEFFDLVLSTQVLEHMVQPRQYLREAWRLVKPTGRLICTTHGSFPDHGCPDDYRRWTADGLTREVRQAGFHPTETFKITTDARALFHLVDEVAASVAASRKTTFGLFLWLLRSFVVARREAVHRLVDKHFGSCRVVPADDPARLYLGLMCVARKSSA